MPPMMFLLGKIVFMMCRSLLVLKFLKVLRIFLVLALVLIEDFVIP